FHHTLRPAVETGARLLHRHEQEIAVHGDVALSARTHHRGGQARTRRAVDVVEVEAVVVADDDVIAAESEVGVVERETLIRGGGSGWLRRRGWLRRSRCGGRP